MFSGNMVEEFVLSDKYMMIVDDHHNAVEDDESRFATNTVKNNLRKSE